MENKAESSEMISKKMVEISNYITALKSLLCFRRFVMEKANGTFYFGANLNLKESNKTLTPDILVKLPNGFWVGEIKKSLCKPENFPKNKDYIKDYIESRIINQLKSYDNSFKEIDSIEHDLILMLPKRDIEAVGYLKVKYLEKKEKEGIKMFNNKFALITYSITNGAQTEFIMLDLEKGELSDSSITELLKIGYKKMSSELKEDLGKFKIYEEADKTPIEYIMVLMWTEIFPELINKGDIEKIIEWKDKKEHVFEVKLSDLVKYLKDMYTLPSFNSNDRLQFNKTLIMDAMKGFQKIKFKNERTQNFDSAVELIGENEDKIFKVRYRSLPEKDELKFILRAMNKETDELKTPEKTVDQTELNF
ncbi:MAG: hypothetical protein AABW82_02015 [Nanoarchaeota archaeon]